MRKLKTLIAAAVAFGSFFGASAQVLYKVEGNGLKKPSYVFGTHHLAPVSVIQKFGAEDTFKSTSQVVGEIDMTQDQMALAMAMQPHMMAPADSTLSKVISPEDFAIVSKEFEKWAPMPGMTLQMLDAMKPMAVSSMIAVGMASQAMPGYDPSVQLDTYFQTEGVKEGKKIIPLETAEQQATLLFDFNPIAYQAESLVETLKDPSEAISQTRELTDAYMNQDLDKMYALAMKDDSHPEFMLALLDLRNADWLAKLPAIFTEAPTFVAVGALHLAGPQGLIAGLRSLGYTVTPVDR